MGNFFNAVRRGVQSMGEAPTGERYIVAGNALRCAHCAGDRFAEGRAQRNSAGMTFSRVR